MVLYSESIRNAAAEYLKKLSLREKIGQMVQFNSRNVNFLREKMSDAEIMARYPFGSYFSGSDVIDLIGHRIRGQEKLESVKAAAKIPLLIAGDLENGAGGESAGEAVRAALCARVCGRTGLYGAYGRGDPASGDRGVSAGFPGAGPYHLTAALRCLCHGSIGRVFSRLG